MPFSFKIDNPRDVKATFDIIKIRIAENNGKLSGDDVSSHIFSDGTEGSYVVGATSIEITIYKKPLLIIPNQLVEYEIRNIFREVN